jgi:hypothetical protein
VHSFSAKGVLVRVILVIVFAIVLGASVFPQSPTGSIGGIVFDTDARTIPGAEIIVVNDLTRVQYETKTNEAGIYAVPNLPPGPYRVQASKVGFKTLIKPDIIVNVQDAITINFTLPVGAASIAVTVEGGAPMINTTDATVSTVVDRNFVENMPLNGRSFQDLILLTAGVVTASPQTGSSIGSTGEFSVNGQRTESNYYMVDGVSANGGISPATPAYLGNSGSLPPSTALGTTQGLVSVDALQEFRVQSSTYSAEYGRNPGGQFSFVTRSGTNDWHGSAFDYLRNNVFDANDWFNNYYEQAEPPLRQNDFGGTLGGPVDIPRVYKGKDRTFFFFSYEGLRLLQPQASVATYVPDVALRTSAPGALGKVMNAFPLPNGPEIGNGQAIFRSTWSNPNSIDSTSIRIDHAINDKLKLFFRFSDTPSSSVVRQYGASASIVETQAYTSKSSTLGATSAHSSGLGNEFRFNYSTNTGNVINQLDDFGGATPVNLAKLQGINTSTYPTAEVVFFLFFGNYPELVQGTNTSSQTQQNIIDTVSLSRGRHQLRFGVDYRKLAPTLRQSNPDVGYQYYSPASIAANNADRAFADSFAPAYPLYRNLSLFVQDAWRLNPRLTLSTGLRWDLDPAPGVTRGLKPYTVQGGSNLATTSLAPEGTPLWQTSWYNFAPRVGAAYILRTRADFETVVRGGGGVFYDSGQQAGSWGFTGAGFNAYFSPTGQLNFPLPSLSAPPPISNPPTPPYGQVYAFPPHLQLPYTWQTNVSLEQALGKNQSLTAAYVGAFGRKLLEQTSVNITPVNPDFLGLNFFRNGLSSDYNALQFRFQRRLSRGLQALGSYTWSHCIDYGSENYSYPYKRGNCDYDVRQNLSTAISYEVPNAFKSGFARAVLHHWALDDRFTLRTAFPVTLDGQCTFVPTIQQYQCLGLNLVPGQPTYLYGANCNSVLLGLGDLSPGQGCPGGKAINPNAFAEPGGSEYGNAPRNFARGFGAWQMDLAVRREFPVSERLKLQFRAEAFNIFNHPSFGAINSYYGYAGFGLATQTLAQSLGGLSPLYQIGGPRSLQFALKVLF